MASANVTVVCSAKPDEVLDTEVTIVGGGICGILAAKQCTDRRWPYVVVDRNDELGGVWGTLANSHSFLQVREGGGGRAGDRPCGHASPPLRPLGHLDWAPPLRCCRRAASQHLGASGTPSARPAHKLGAHLDAHAPHPQQPLLCICRCP